MVEYHQDAGLLERGNHPSADWGRSGRPSRPRDGRPGWRASIRRRRLPSGWPVTRRGHRPPRAWPIPWWPRRWPCPTRRAQGRHRHLRHHLIPSAVHHPGDGPGQGQVRHTAREHRAVRLAQPCRPRARRSRPIPPDDADGATASRTTSRTPEDLEDKIVDRDRRGTRRRWSRPACRTASAAPTSP